LFAASILAKKQETILYIILYTRLHEMLLCIIIPHRHHQLPTESADHKQQSAQNLQQTIAQKSDPQFQEGFQKDPIGHDVG
jgi:hypothetical protein